MNPENNESQNNNLLWLGLGLVGGAITAYWLMKNKLDKKDQELSQVISQEKEQELKKIQEQVQGLEQQLVKLNEEANKQNNPYQGNLISYLSQWFRKFKQKYLVTGLLT